jgi:hypothetical protein
MRHRSGQAIVEVLVLAPLAVALLVAFALALERVTALAEAERALGQAVRALAAGEPLPVVAPTMVLRSERGVVHLRVRLAGPDLALRAPRILR